MYSSQVVGLWHVVSTCLVIAVRMAALRVSRYRAAYLLLLCWFLHIQPAPIDSSTRCVFTPPSQATPSPSTALAAQARPSLPEKTSAIHDYFQHLLSSFLSRYFNGQHAPTRRRKATTPPITPPTSLLACSTHQATFHNRNPQLHSQLPFAAHSHVDTLVP
jgi:hypothetical protein